MQRRPVADIRKDLRFAQFRMNHAIIRGDCTDEMRQAVRTLEAELATTGRPLYPTKLKGENVR